MTIKDHSSFDKYTRTPLYRELAYHFGDSHARRLCKLVDLYVAIARPVGKMAGHARPVLEWLKR
jgi:hypothetical protein